MNEVGLLFFLVAAQTDGENITKERCVGITGLQASVLLEIFCLDKCIESELGTLTFRVCVNRWIDIVLHSLFKFTETKKKSLTDCRLLTWEDWYNSHLYLCKTTASSWLAYLSSKTGNMREHSAWLFPIWTKSNSQAQYLKLVQIPCLFNEGKCCKSSRQTCYQQVKSHFPKFPHLF